MTNAKVGASSDPSAVAKCIVANCDNDEAHGRMVGNFCFPCYDFLTTGKGTNNQVVRNASSLVVRRLREDLSVAAIEISTALKAINRMKDLVGDLK